MNNVILYSGGIDSFLVHQELESKKIEHELLYFNMGAKCNPYEIRLFNKPLFKEFINSCVVINDCLRMGSLEHDDAFIPNRNILAAIMAHSVTNYDNIWIGGTLSDRVNDNNEEVFNKLSELLSEMYNKEIKITSPFYNEHKVDVVSRYISSNGFGLYGDENTARDSLVYATFSCYKPLKCCRDDMFYYPDGSTVQTKTHECLKCSACFRKCLSLYAGDIFRPMDISAKEIVDHYYNEAVKYVQDNDDDIFSSGIMLPRMKWTIKYCEKWYSYEGL